MRRALSGRARQRMRPKWRPAPILATFTGRVGASADDAFEALGSGAVFLGPEETGGGTLGLQSTTNDAVRSGVRFTNVTIPQGGSVQYAVVRFVARAPNTFAPTFRIRAEAIDDAPAFAATNDNLGTRAVTTAYVDWSPPDWSMNQDDGGTTPPNLAAVVQEVVNRPGWVSGNALVLLFIHEPEPAGPGYAATGRRRPYFYDDATDFAPRLLINTSEDPGPGDPGDPPPTPGDFSDGYDLFGLEGRGQGTGEGQFNPNSPTLKNGGALSGVPLTAHNAIVWWAQNAHTYSGSFYNPIDRFSHYNNYSNGRYGRIIQRQVMPAFRLTGDLRILDKLIDWFNYRYNAFVIPWDMSFTNADQSNLEGRGTWCTNETDSASPYPKILHDQTVPRYAGTNLDHNTGIYMSHTAEFVWALWVNRGKASPAGHNYQAEFNKWQKVIRQWVWEWSGYHGGQCWEAYHTRDGYTLGATSGEYRRPSLGVPPFYATNGGHKAFAAIVLNRYVGLLSAHAGLDTPDGEGLYVPNGQAFVSKTVEMAERIIPHGGVYCSHGSNLYGPNYIHTRSFYFGPGTPEHTGAQYTTYIGNIAHHYIDLWLSGGYRTVFTREHMMKVARSYADCINTDGSPKRNLAGETAKCGLSANGGSDRTVGDNARNGYSSMCVFEAPGETRLSDTADLVQTNLAGWSTPRGVMLASALMVQQVLTDLGDLGAD